jgi:hypothetical protein
MTRKDFEAFASIIRSNKLAGGDAGTLANAVEELCAHFERRNLAFDLDRFLEACGMPNGEWAI